MVRKYLLVAAALLALSGCSTLGEGMGRGAFGGSIPDSRAHLGYAVMNR